MIIILNKPFNTLCQFTDNQDRDTLKNYIQISGLYPAGRLDRDSEGLVVLTDDGNVQHLISHPRHKLPKTYWAQVEGLINDQALAQLAHGVELKDGKTAPAVVQRLSVPEIWPRQPPIRERAAIPTCWIELTLREGKNRQVRRMTAAVGFPTLRLIRYAVGPWTIAGLAPGHFRQVPLDDLLENAPLARQWRKMAQRPAAKTLSRKRPIARQRQTQNKDHNRQAPRKGVTKPESS